MNQRRKVLTIISDASNSVPTGGWLRHNREILGLSRREVAEQLGVTIPAIQDYERSEAAGRITLTTLRKYAAVLGCEVTVSVTPRNGAHSAPSPKKPAPPPPQSPRKLSKPSAIPRPSEEPQSLNDRMGLWSAD